MKKIFLLLYIFYGFAAYAQNTNTDEIINNIFLDSLLNSDNNLSKFLKQKKENNIQIIYTKIDRDTANAPYFTDHYYNLNHNQYFYPASTVKLPIALLSLEKVNDLEKFGVTKESVMITDSSAAKQEIIYNDPSSENGAPTIANYIKKIFLVSNNDAYNRLYEFLGQSGINKKLKQKGFNHVAIRHRFQTSLNDEDNKVTNPVSFYDSTGKLLYKQSTQYSKIVFSNQKILLGKGHYAGNTLIDKPFDFSQKNRIYLDDLHGILKAVLFPEAMPEEEQFNLTDSDYSFLYRWMSAYPRESKYPYYDSVVYSDDFVKYFLQTDNQKHAKPNIRIFNKVGMAYGFLTDVAYIIDTAKNIEFMLSATISCNSDGIYNDDKYDYQTVGFPFMKKLSEVIYNYETNRTRLQKPDLTKFIINYSN